MLRNTSNGNISYTNNNGLNSYDAKGKNSQWDDLLLNLNQLVEFIDICNHISEESSYGLTCITPHVFQWFIILRPSSDEHNLYFNKDETGQIKHRVFGFGCQVILPGEIHFQRAHLLYTLSKTGFV